MMYRSGTSLPASSKGFGFFQSKSWTAFSPVAVTPDELGNAWDGRKVHRPVLVHVNGVELGHPNAGTDMEFDFPRLISGLETIDTGKPVSTYLRFGDRVRIEMLDERGDSIFGAIDQQVVRDANPSGGSLR